MSELKSRLIAMIRADGPMTVGAYMNTCLHDPKHGYYATRPGLGTDFITAPETSQVFGELLGLWAAHEWGQMGAPANITLCEIGPGRGTLMQDALRAAGTVAGFGTAKDLHLIEPSPALQTVLSDRLGEHNPTFIAQLQDLPTNKPLIILANEWLDCLPARQFVKTGDTWAERVIGIGPGDTLTFGLAADTAPAETAANDEAFELQVGLETLVDTLKDLFARLEANGHAARVLLIDYGPADARPADTLRAYTKGAQVGPLHAPGETDLTVDVDFGRLAALANAAGIAASRPTPQGEFLMRLGAEARLNQLAKSAPAQASALFDGVKTLVDPEQMGTRFNAICLSTAGLPPPAGLD
jgi:NADH dehydrogenase [ubiquinone] 1 alpha subcomplex assembly factor 7